MENTRYSKKEYIDRFEVNNPHSPLLQAAFLQASDIRKFEIELYWKRATYFWALIAVAFAGYFAVSSSSISDGKGLFLTIISSAGFVFTFAWFSANKGSKYWQENWENHLDLLEDSVTGPLYKSYLQRPDEKHCIDRHITGPRRYSVSKINQWVAVFTLFIWFILCFFSLSNQSERFVEIFFQMIVFVFAAVICCFMVYKGKTYDGLHGPEFYLRQVEIKNATIINKE